MACVKHGGDSFCLVKDGLSCDEFFLAFPPLICLEDTLEFFDGSAQREDGLQLGAWVGWVGWVG